MPMRMRYGRTPDTIAILAMLAVLAGWAAVAGNPPGSLVEMVPLWLARGWALALALSAGVALAGVLHRDELTGWGLELGGRVGVALTLLGYGLLAASVATASASIVVGLVLAFAVSSGFRVYQLARRVGEFRAALGAVKRAGRSRRGRHELG